VAAGGGSGAALRADGEGRELGEGRSARKRRAIMGAARELFLQHGYAGTSMDDVAALAGVSKQTVYKHFVDKQQLFIDLITADIAQVEGPTHPLIEAMPESEDVERDLRAYARWHLANVMQPHLLRMRRVLIGEADRFPELAQAWYRSGPVRSCAIFARWFEALDRRGLLCVDDPQLAAQHFNWLVLSIPINQAMFSVDVDFAPDHAVRIFLAA
jgi:AcrR family transcriptional regulator